MKKARVYLVMLFAMFMFSGCSVVNVEELYSLPQPQEEYLQLQKLINKEIAAGGEYSAPTLGSRRQSVQLTDLDGDGADEALVFLRDKNAQPQICIYCKNAANQYARIATIEGDGAAVGHVEYADFNGDGISEIAVSWKMNEEMRLLELYSIKNWTTTALLTIRCTDFQTADIDSNGMPELMSVNLDGKGGDVSMIRANLDGEVITTSTRLSKSLANIERFRVGYIAEKVPAVFVEGRFPNNNSEALLTDIIIYSDEKLKNIMLDSTTGDSRATRRYPVYCTDIDGNGTIDVPFAEKLKNHPKASVDYYIFDWFNYYADGDREICASTYHCYNDDWYFELPPNWRNNLMVRRETALAGERSVTFSTVDENGGKITDLMTIYVLSDENRNDRAKLDGRFILLGGETTIYAAEFNTDDRVTKEQKQDIIQRFHLIYSEWITGDLG
ncbi:MAG: VCBS repeat-containing protein [Oscillospiraceae bacterium]